MKQDVLSTTGCCVEFSFERNRSNLGTNSTSNQKPSSGVGASQAQQSNLDQEDLSHIQNDRLRKALERNRQRMLKREYVQGKTQATASEQVSSRPASPPPPPAQEKKEEYTQTSFLWGNESKAQAQSTQSPQDATEETVRPTFTYQKPEVFAEEVTQEEVPKTLPTRRSVGKPDSTEFTSSVRRTTRKATPQIGYATSSARKREKASLDQKYVDWLVKGSWIFCGLMFLRLIFVDGGIVDLYKRKAALRDRVHEYQEIVTENKAVSKEIDKMLHDQAFQKKLVRDNLGFISKDEYLILFPN